VLNAQEVNQAINNLSYPGSKDREALAEYQRQERELVAQFHAYLDEEHGYELNEAQQKKTHSFAYEASNGGGYYDYEHQYQEAAEFARDILGLA
jgi:hypothetical protein